MTISSPHNMSHYPGGAQHEVITLPPPSPWERAAEVARHGQVAWLAEQGQEAFALMPATLAHEALTAWQEAKDAAVVKASRARRAAGERGIPWEQLKAEIDAELGQSQE